MYHIINYLSNKYEFTDHVTIYFAANKISILDKSFVTSYPLFSVNLYLNYQNIYEITNHLSANPPFNKLCIK